MGNGHAGPSPQFWLDHWFREMLIVSNLQNLIVLYQQILPRCLVSRCGRAHICRVRALLGQHRPGGLRWTLAAGVSQVQVSLLIGLLTPWDIFIFISIQSLSASLQSYSSLWELSSWVEAVCERYQAGGGVGAALGEQGNGQSDELLWCHHFRGETKTLRKISGRFPHVRV